MRSGGAARRRTGRLHGLAVFPLVEARAALAAELLLRDERIELTEIGRRAAQLRGDDLADVARHIETDDVGKLHGSHRHAEIHRGLVDDRERHAFLRGVHGFVQVGHEHAIDDEARRAPAGHGQLVEPARERERRLRGGRIRRARRSRFR